MHREDQRHHMWMSLELHVFVVMPLSCGIHWSPLSLVQTDSYETDAIENVLSFMSACEPLLEGPGVTPWFINQDVLKNSSVLIFQSLAREVPACFHRGLHSVCVLQDPRRWNGVGNFYRRSQWSPHPLGMEMTEFRPLHCFLQAGNS